MPISKTISALYISIAALAILPGCTTSLANRTPIDIASNSVRHTDALSGVSEVLGPRVQVFTSNGSRISGTAQLRTAGAFTDSQGQVFKGGSYLDILVNYTTPTPRPEEARLFNKASWAGGESVLFAEFGSAVLDCRQNIRENYTPNYSSYGYGGYRGYSSFGYGYNSHGRHRVRDHDGHHNDDHNNTNHNNTTHSPNQGGGNTGGNVPTPTERDLSLEPYMGNEASTRRHGGGALPTTRRSILRQNDVIIKPRAIPKPPTKAVPTPRTTKPVIRSKSIQKNNKNFRRTELNYYPSDTYYGGGYTDVQVSYRCVREESLRIFIPRDRMDNAEQNGLTLYLRPKVGREEAVYLPRNYITGFKLAAYSPQGQQFTIQGEPIDLSKRMDKTTTSTQQSTSPPIIYGQP
ncbi:MAG: hypothetical protein JKX72_05335 [Robiginitomaculum sp.]|nr:hypothetical protein [Robiginitomaculum sp.]